MFIYKFQYIFYKFNIFFFKITLYGCKIIKKENNRYAIVLFF